MQDNTIEKNIELKALNTFGLSAKALNFVRLSDTKMLPEIMASDAYQIGPLLWLGGGSNIVFQDNVSGLVIQVATRGIEKVKEDESHVWVDVAAGEVWHDWVLYAIEQGWFGLENLSLIPGTVGAAPVQNIGAYGVEVKDVIDAVFAIHTQSGEKQVFLHDDCQFAYRNSIFKNEVKGQYFIEKVRFRLNKAFHAKTGYGDLQSVAKNLAQGGDLNAKIISDAVIQLRQSKLPDPHVLGNVGSFFHNPIVSLDVANMLTNRYPELPRYPYQDHQVKLAAGWLIDQAGLKGFSIGHACVHAKQALVLVNTGNATSEDVLLLCKHIQKTVREAFGINLMPEPSFIPEKAPQQ